jgi:cell division protein FtsB
MMDIDKAFEQFIEFPEGSSGNLVTTVSAKLFAKYCTETLQEENERLQADVERLRKQVHELQNQREHMYDTMLQWRGIERENGDEPCRGCNGSGVRAYGNTTTWRGGVGGQVITSDVCDKCWGSGNSENVWVNLKSIARISRKEAELVDVCGQLRAEVERLQLQLAACGVVAMANTPDSAARQRDMHPDYMSASCQDVIRAVDREMALREERDQLKAQVNGMKQAIDDLVRNSEGVAGLHQNGDVAPWDELLTGGRFDEWLCVLDDTPQQCLATHDAEVIERAREYVTSIVEESDFAVDYDLALLEYGKKLRQRAKEVQS